MVNINGLKIKGHILSIPVYKPGRPISEIRRIYGVRNIIKLAANENPLGPSPKALSEIYKKAKDTNRYPDGSGFYLKDAIGRIYHIRPSNIILGNGTNEILHMLSIVFVRKGSEVIFGSPSFVVYEIEGLLQEAKIKKVRLKNFRFDLKEILSCITSNTSVVFISNPNNPTGTFVSENEVKDFMKSVPPHVLVVFDEAYAEYVQPDIFPDTIRYVRQCRNVIVLRTFSKIYGLAGLRIGYGLAKASIIRAIEHVRQPFNVNAVAQSAALAALRDREHLKKSFDMNQHGLRYLSREFKRLGLNYVPSGANFIMVHIGREAGRVFQRLLKGGIIVRPLGGELSGYIRVTVGRPHENVTFIKKLERCLK